jgi:pimeloyl-ACP methyl ester carboxylesterase
MGTETTQVTVGDLTFDARVAGPPEGEPVMLLHGFPQTSYEWRHQIRALADAGYRAFAPDQRGYSPGARPEPVDQYAMPLLIGDVMGMADALGFDRFHVVAHDWGASVAWVLGAFVSDRVLSLTSVSIPHLDAFNQMRADPSSCQSQASSYVGDFVQPDYEDVFLADDAAQLRGIFEGVAEADIDVYVEALGSKEALGAALNWYRANTGSTTEPGATIGPVAVPTMYVWSDGDRAICLETAELTADFVTGSYRFEVIEGVNHWIPDLAPERLSDLILEQVGSHGGAP